MSPKQQDIGKVRAPARFKTSSAYIIFAQSYHEEFRKAGKAIPKLDEFSKGCQERWTSMSDAERATYHPKTHTPRDRARMKREMSVYKNPQEPKSAFMLFMADFRKEITRKEPESDVTALAKAGGARWRAMSDEEKQPYVELSKSIKPGAQNRKTAPRDQGEYRSRTLVWEGPPTAFMLFMQEFRNGPAGKEASEGGLAALARAGGETWRAMSDEEKQPYVELHRQQNSNHGGKRRKL